MAKLLIIVALLLVAFVAEAHTPPPASAPPPVKAPPPHPLKKIDSFSLKCVIHNIADRCVTFSLEVAGKATKKVEAESGCWTAIEPVSVTCKTPVVYLCATVKTDKGVLVTKSFPLNLLDQFKFIEPNCLKVLPVLACETMSLLGSKCIEIKVWHKTMVSFTL